jgi:hypothetical protein
MRKPDYANLIANIKPREVEMPYESKPLLPEIADADVGDMVVLEGVTVIRELWRGTGDNKIVMSSVERGGSEGVVKVFDGSTLPQSQVITAVGKKAKHNEKYSVEVKAGEGGGIALDGEPLAVVDPQPAQVQAPVAVPTSTPVAKGKGRLTVSEHREAKVTAFKWYYEHIVDYEKDDVAILAAKVKVSGAFASGESISEARNEIIPDLPF